VDVFGTKLPQPPLLCGIECSGSGNLDPYGLRPWGQSNPHASSVPLRRGIASVRVSTLVPISVAFTILSIHCAHDLVEGLEGSHSELRDADPPTDAAGWEARHASSEKMQAQLERERDRRTTRRVAKGRATEASSRFVSSGEGEVELGAALRPPSPPRMTPSPHQDAVPLQTGSLASECRLKCP
jgi:hypothetical protein